MSKIDREPDVAGIAIQIERELDIDRACRREKERALSLDLPSTCEEGLEDNRFRV